MFMEDTFNYSREIGTVKVKSCRKHTPTYCTCTYTYYLVSKIKVRLESDNSARHRTRRLYISIKWYKANLIHIDSAVVCYKT